DAELPIEPYVLGCWLGDGTKDSSTLTSADPGILEAIRATGTAVGAAHSQVRGQARAYTLGTRKGSAVCRRGHVKTRYWRGRHCGACERERRDRRRHGQTPFLWPEFAPTAGWTEFTLMEKLRSLDLLGDKHIPPLYLRAAPAQRLALLQGLMDTD